MSRDIPNAQWSTHKRFGTFLSKFWQSGLDRQCGVNADWAARPDPNPALDFEVDLAEFSRAPRATLERIIPELSGLGDSDLKTDRKFGVNQHDRHKPSEFIDEELGVRPRVLVKRGGSRARARKLRLRPGVPRRDACVWACGSRAHPGHTIP